jgi:Ca2+-binding RTX toxin-like protein
MASPNGWFLTSAIKRVFEGLGAAPAAQTANPRRPPLRRKPLFEALEHRLLLSADPVGALAPTDPVEGTEAVVSAPLVDDDGDEAAGGPTIAVLPVAEPDIDGDACGFDGDGVFRVAGAAGEPVSVELDWTLREAVYNNEVGIYRVSGQDGSVGNLRPGDAGYAEAALAAGNAQVVFKSGASAGAHAAFELAGGATYAFYVIQNGKTSTFLSANPDNTLDGGPLAFFSIAAANPDRFDHVHADIQPQTGLLALRWEDLTRGGDADYNDVVMTATGLAASSDDVLYTYDANALDVDVDGDGLTYRLAEGPKGAFIDPDTGVLSWAATAGVFHQVRGGKGNDLLIADTGDDFLKGEDGNDILVGGAGNDKAEGNYGADLFVDGPGCDSTGWLSSQDRVVDGTQYEIPVAPLPQPAGPVIDWSSRYQPMISSLQQFGDHPSNPQWWQDFVNNLGQTDADTNPNSRIRVVGPEEGM